LIEEPSHHLKGQPGLAAAARPSQREKPRRTQEALINGNLSWGADVSSAEEAGRDHFEHPTV